MIVGDLSKAKSYLLGLSVRVGMNFVRIVESIHLAHGGVAAIRTGVYQLPEFRIPDGLSPDVRQILPIHMTELRLGGMLASVDAAAMVFAHAILDDLATECCKVIAMADPSAWETAVINKEVRLSALKARPFEEIYASLLQQYVAKLERSPWRRGSTSFIRSVHHLPGV